MKKSILVILFFVAGLFANSQSRLPIKVFSNHSERRAHFGKNIQDDIVKLNSDSTIEWVNYELSSVWDLLPTYFIKTIYFGKYEFRNDSIFVRNLLVSQTIKNSNQKKYYINRKSLPKPFIIHSVFFTVKEDKISSNLFPDFFPVSLSIINMMEFKFQTWDKQYGESIIEKMRRNENMIL